MYNKETHKYEAKEVDNRLKVTKEMVIEIDNIEYDKEKWADKLTFYEFLAEKFNIGVGTIRMIKRKTKDIVADDGSDRLKRMTIVKKVDEKIAVEYITELYYNYFNKKPDYISANDRYATLQIAIRPELIFFQIDEYHMTNLNNFKIIAKRAFNESVRIYETNKKERRYTLQQMKDNKLPHNTEESK